MLNATHDPALVSWVTASNQPDSDFPIQNLPFGVVRKRGRREAFRGAVAIGDQALDLAAAGSLGLLEGAAQEACAAASGPELNPLMSLGPAAWSELRRSLSRMLRDKAPEADRLATCLIPLNQVEYAVPARIGDFTDMYTSIDHATNVGRLFRPDNPLMPSFKWIPMGYHARVSSIGVSGQSFRRPTGQLMLAGAEQPVLEPTRRLDYELELGIWVGPGNALGEPIDLSTAESHVFGIGLLNDWSARDIQAWEYQPLGPLLGKNFATTVSPWIITTEALEPFRSAWHRPETDPQPLPYLEAPQNRRRGAFDIRMEAWIQTASMVARGLPPERLSCSNFKEAYWTLAQMLTHHTVNGCNLQAGDLIGSGTQSGKGPGEAGALIEITEGGKRPVQLACGERRSFLEDGDTVILRGGCERSGFRKIGFGECLGTVLPARPLSV